MDCIIPVPPLAAASHCDRVSRSVQAASMICVLRQMVAEMKTNDRKSRDPRGDRIALVVMG